MRILRRGRSAHGFAVRLRGAQPSKFVAVREATPVGERGAATGKGELRNRSMIKWAVIFLVVALIAALFGFTGLAVAAAEIAKFLFGLFLLLCLVFFILGGWGEEGSVSAPAAVPGE